MPDHEESHPEVIPPAMTQDIARTAYEVYMTLMKERNIWMDRSFAKDRPAWMNIANYVIQRNMDVVLFIRAQIEAIGKKEELQAFTPNMILKSPGMAQARFNKMVPTSKVEDYRAMYGVMKLHLYQLQQLHARTGVDHFLVDPGLPFTAWFRVLLVPAQAEGFQPIMDYYREQASAEVIADPCLREFLEELKSDYDLTRFGRRCNPSQAQGGC